MVFPFNDRPCAVFASIPYACNSRRLVCVLRLKNIMCVRSTVLTKSPKSCAWKSCSWRLAADQSYIFHSVDNLFLHFRFNREQQNRPESKMNRRVYVHRVWNNGKPVKLTRLVDVDAAATAVFATLLCVHNLWLFRSYFHLVDHRPDRRNCPQ